MCHALTPCQMSNPDWLESQGSTLSAPFAAYLPEKAATWFLILYVHLLYISAYLTCHSIGSVFSPLRDWVPKKNCQTKSAANGAHMVSAHPELFPTICTKWRPLISLPFEESGPKRWAAVIRGFLQSTALLFKLPSVNWFCVNCQKILRTFSYFLQSTLGRIVHGLSSAKCKLLSGKLFGRSLLNA